MLQSNYCHYREQLIARCLPGLVSELRLVDVEHLIAFITLQMYNHVADLVASASEHHFAPGFITLGHGCDIAVDWNCPPVITIDLIMNLGWAKAYFSVTLQDDCADVRLNYFAGDMNSAPAEDNNRRLAETIKLNCLN